VRRFDQGPPYEAGSQLFHRSNRMGDLWVAVILGIVEGLTEFLPVSSTGHLIVVGDLMNFSGDKAKCFEIFIQLGAILAVVCLYWRRFIGLIPYRGIRFGEAEGFSGARGLGLLFLTSVPAATVGLLAHKAIKYYLFGPMTVAWALLVGGIAMLLAEKYKPESHIHGLDGISYRQALVVGFFQCFALWPGMSRSASTIIGGLFSGLDRKTATEYSFMAAVPIMIAATCFDLYKGWDLFQAEDFTFLAVGFVVSFVSAALAIKGFIALVQRWSLAPYAWYRIAIAPVIYLVMKQ
jgi:undecaprenyl-diphosphatase